jgi:Replication-relaxation
VSSSRSAGRDRVVRPRRRPDPSGAALTPLDRDLLAVLCAHRVVTQEQLGRLFPAVPERTLRYRTRRLHDLGLAGRSRPYRERGSAPNHHWPTRHADCLMRGDPTPRGGERRQPNPVFLAHAAALTDLYVTLSTGVGTLGLTLEGYGREGAAREAFEFEGRDRAIAPDAGVHLRDGEGRDLLAFVEVDLGTMSHARLRQKAELYAAYADARAWEGRFRFLPALLFLTTSDVRAGRFLKSLGAALAYGRKRRGRREFAAAANVVHACLRVRLHLTPTRADSFPLRPWERSGVSPTRRPNPTRPAPTLRTVRQPRRLRVLSPRVREAPDWRLLLRPNHAY